MFSALFKKSVTQPKTKFELFCEKEKLQEEQKTSHISVPHELTTKHQIPKHQTPTSAEIFDKINRIEIKLDNGYRVSVPYDRSKRFARPSKALDLTGYDSRIVQYTN